MQSMPTEPSAATRSAAGIAGLALVTAAVGVGGSLYLSIGMGLQACPLCFYQRTFVMAAFAVLLLGLMTSQTRPGLICLLALPLAVGGLGVAAYHEYLVVSGKLECPDGILGLGTAPIQSLAMFVVLTLATAAGTVAGRMDWIGQSRIAGVIAPVLGLLLAWGCIASSPPPKKPDKPRPVDQPLIICQPVYQPPGSN